MKIENRESASTYIKLFLAHSGNTLTTFLLPKRIAVTVIFHSGLDMTDNMNPYGYTMSMTLTTFKIFLLNGFPSLNGFPVFWWPARFLLGHMSVTFGKIPSFQLPGHPNSSPPKNGEELRLTYLSKFVERYGGRKPCPC